MSALNNKNILSKLIFGLSVFVTAYWILGQLFDIYKIAFIGALFEILWLPMLASLFCLPLISIYHFIKEKYNFKSLYFISLLIQLSTIFVLFAFFD